MSNIHPTAIIDPTAHIDPTATIGAYCVVGADSHIGAYTQLRHHVIVGKNTTIGKHNIIYQFASVGEDPQDLKYQGETTYLELGDYNRIRESCTLHRGTGDGGGLTKIGNHNLLMVNTHIAHDCMVGDHNVLANNVGVAGHVVIGDYAILGGNTGVHQFCRIGSYSMIAAASLILKDVAAFVKVAGNPAKAYGLNTKGMQRKQWDKSTIERLKQAYRLVFCSNLTKEEAIAALSASDLLQQEPKVALLLQSLQNSSKQGLTR